MNHIETADDIRYAVLLLDRLRAHDYLINATKEHDRRWGKCEWVWHDVPGEPYCTVEFVYEKATNEREQQRARAEFSRCGDHADYMEQQDVDELFEHLRKYHRHWWN